MKKIWSTEDVSSGMLARRRFLTGTAALLGGAALTPLLAAAARAAVGGPFQLMAWQGWELTDELADWYTASGIIPEFTAMGSQDDVTIKFSAPNPPALRRGAMQPGLCRPLS